MGWAEPKTSLKCIWYTIKGFVTTRHTWRGIFFCCLSVGDMSIISWSDWSLASTFANEKNNLFLVRIFWTTCVLGWCQFLLLLLCLDFNGDECLGLLVFSHNSENNLASSLMSIFCLHIASYMLLLLYFPYYIETVEDIDHCQWLHRIWLPSAWELHPYWGNQCLMSHRSWKCQMFSYPGSLTGDVQTHNRGPTN